MDAEIAAVTTVAIGCLFAWAMELDIPVRPSQEDILRRDIAALKAKLQAEQKSHSEVVRGLRYLLNDLEQKNRPGYRGQAPKTRDTVSLGEGEP